MVYSIFPPRVILCARSAYFRRLIQASKADRLDIPDLNAEQLNDVRVTVDLFFVVVVVVCGHVQPGPKLKQAQYLHLIYGDKSLAYNKKAAVCQFWPSLD